MKIGIPKEIKAQENRVSMIPGCVSELVKRGHQVGASIVADAAIAVDQ